MFHYFQAPPYGGSNQFLLALVAEFERRGLRVERNAISAGTRGCLFNSSHFDLRRLEAFARSGCRMVHRVDGPVGVYRGFDDGTDELVRDINRRFAHATVFQSEYSLRRHRELGLDFVDPIVVHNAVDPAIFNRTGRAMLDRDRPTRLISVSWSDNPNKGGETYAWLDSVLDRTRFEYTFVGRTSTQLPHARTLPPVPSERLAEVLREHDLLVTASLHESCPNHVLEALACGLPVVYANSGAMREVIDRAGLMFADRSELPSLLERAVADYEGLQAAIDVPGIEDVADRYLAALGFEPHGLDEAAHHA